MSFLQEQQRPVSKASTAQARVSITLQEGAVTSVRRVHLSQLAATSNCSHITILTLYPAFSGGSKTLSFQRSRPCVTCSGKGLIRDGPDCMRCNGNGVTVATVCAFFDFVLSMPDLNRSHVTSRAAQVQVMMGLHQQVQMKCAACAGTGAEGCRVQKLIRQHWGKNSCLCSNSSQARACGGCNGRKITAEVRCFNFCLFHGAVIMQCTLHSLVSHVRPYSV